jgi:hypothetical protein
VLWRDRFNGRLFGGHSITTRAPQFSQTKRLRQACPLATNIQHVDAATPLQDPKDPSCGWPRCLCRSCVWWIPVQQRREPSQSVGGATGGPTSPSLPARGTSATASNHGERIHQWNEAREPLEHNKALLENGIKERNKFLEQLPTTKTMLPTHGGIHQEGDTKSETDTADASNDDDETKEDVHQTSS